MAHVSLDSYPCKCNAVPGALQSKFTASEKPYGAGYVMQSSKCIGLQILPSIKIVWSSKHSVTFCDNLAHVIIICVKKEERL